MNIKEFMWDHAEKFTVTGAAIFVLLLLGFSFADSLLLGVLVLGLVLFFGGIFISISRPWNYKKNRE